MAKSKSTSRSSSRSSGGGRSSSASRGSRGAKGGAAQTTTDHAEIRQWAEERGGRPACVKGTQGGDSCLLRIDFPGGAGAESLEQISWDEFFDVMDEGGLQFLHQKGNSTFNKIVSPDAVPQRSSKGRGGGKSKSSTRATRSTSTADKRATSAGGAKKSSAARHGRGSR